jgi:hypothetical protein
MTLANLKYFRERAAACERLAEKAEDSKSRETLLYVASRWRALAAEEEEGHRIPRQGDGDQLSSPD